MDEHGGWSSGCPFASPVLSLTSCSRKRRSRSRSRVASTCSSRGSTRHHEGRSLGHGLSARRREPRR